MPKAPRRLSRSGRPIGIPPFWPKVWKYTNAQYIVEAQKILGPLALRHPAALRCTDASAAWKACGLWRAPWNIDSVARRLVVLIGAFRKKLSSDISLDAFDGLDGTDVRAPLWALSPALDACAPRPPSLANLELLASVAKDCYAALDRNFDEESFEALFAAQ